MIQCSFVGIQSVTVHAKKLLGTHCIYITNENFKLCLFFSIEFCYNLKRRQQNMSIIVSKHLNLLYILFLLLSIQIQLQFKYFFKNCDKSYFGQICHMSVICMPNSYWSHRNLPEFPEFFPFPSTFCCSFLLSFCKAFISFFHFFILAP